MTLSPDEFLEPEAPAEAETKIKRSVFLARIEPCRTEAEAKAAIARVQAANRDATHVCWAYLLGPDPLVEYSSDAGEPSGTAGRPILGVLKRSGMVNAVITVTRWFGGVKLGVRGLIEAYSESAELAVSAASPVVRVVTQQFCAKLPYSAIGTVTRLLTDHGAGDNLAWTYAEDASVCADIPASRADSLAAALEELRVTRIIGEWRR